MYYFETDQAENDFLSEWLSSWAGSASGYHTGGVRTQVLGDFLWLWQDTALPPASTLKPFVKWWPGEKALAW